MGGTSQSHIRWEKTKGYKQHGNQGETVSRFSRFSALWRSNETCQENHLLPLACHYPTIQAAFQLPKTAVCPALRSHPSCSYCLEFYAHLPWQMRAISSFSLILEPHRTCFTSLLDKCKASASHCAWHTVDC